MGLQVCGRGAGTEPAVLAPSPPCWLRQRVLRWQGGSCCGARAGCSAGHVQPQSPARCHCQGVQEFFLPRASQLGVSVPLSTCQRRRSACNSFDAAPPTQPLQHRCGCVIPQLSYLHLAQHSCLRAAPALPGAAAAARPHTRLPCPPCPALPRPRSASPTSPVLSWLEVFLLHFGTVESGTDALPSPSLGSFFGSFPFALPGPGQRAKPGLSSAASVNQLNASASSRAEFPLGFTQQQVPLAASVIAPATQVITEVKAMRLQWCREWF